jgi:hypothetical protein
MRQKNDPEITAEWSYEGGIHAADYKTASNGLRTPKIKKVRY